MEDLPVKDIEKKSSKVMLGAIGAVCCVPAAVAGATVAVTAVGLGLTIYLVNRQRKQRSTKKNPNPA